MGLERIGALAVDREKGKMFTQVRLEREYRQGCKGSSIANRRKAARQGTPILDPE